MERRIVLLTNLFPNPTDEGRGVFTKQIALGLRHLCKLTVVCPMPYFPAWKFLKGLRQWYPFSQIPERYSVDGIPVFSPKYPMLPKVSDKAHAALMFSAIFRQLRELKAAEGIDLVNAHWLYPDGVAAVRACKKLGIPVVLTALGCDVNFYGGQSFVGRRIRESVGQSDATTAVSQDLKEKIENWGVCSNSPTTILNGVDLGRFDIRDRDRCRQELSLPQSARVILYVGRLSEEKGLDRLIDAVRVIVDRGGKDILVAVVGDGPNRELYERQISSKGLGQFFLLKGSQDHDAVPTWMGASDLLCLPSLREGCPNVVLEALAAGRPVVASEVGGVPEIVRNGLEGFLCDAGDAEAMADSLEKTLTRKWDGEALRNSVKGRSWEEVAEAYDAVYSSVLGRRKP